MKSGILKEFGLENFRVFKDKTSFELAPITLLTGPNSSGKSSVIKALKLMQNFHQGNFNTLSDVTQKKLSFFENENHSYHHFLSDFESVVNDGNNGKEEIVFNYKVKLDYWDNEKNQFNSFVKIDDFFGILDLTENFWNDLHIEEVFVKDEDSNLKFGKLLKRCIYLDFDGSKLKIFEGKNDNFKQDNFLLPTIIRLHKSLYNDYKYYKEKFDNYLVYVDKKNALKTEQNLKDQMKILDYCGKIEMSFVMGIQERLYAYYPDIFEFCKFAKLDVKKFCLLANMRAGTFGGQHESIPFESKPKFLKSFEDFSEKYLNDSLIDIFCENIQNTNNFSEEHLFQKIKEKYPEKLYSYNFETFISRVKLLDAEILSDYISESEYSKPIHHAGFIVKDECLTLSSIINYFQNPLLDIRNITDDNKDMIFENTQWISIVEYLNVLEYTLKLIDKNDTFIQYQSDDNATNNNPYVFFKNFEESILNIADKTMKSFFFHCEFVEVTKANAQPLYTFVSQGTSFNKYLAEYIDRSHSEEVERFFNKWVSEFEIGDRIDLETDLIRGVGVKLNIINGNKSRNIVDFGYGITQMIALILRIVTAAETGKTTVIIEEPEPNMHPKLQSKLADLFVDANKTFGLNFIVETHSEYIIRKLQILTAEKKITPDDTVIYYIGNPEKNEGQIKKIKIKVNGQLTNTFGYGFFDEADYLALELFKFSFN